MSLANLPDSLIAHIASYLEYEDVCNLMETSKKNYNAIKSYKKDKRKVDCISFSLPNADHQDSQPGFTATTDDDEPISRPFCRRYSESATLVENVRNVLNECSSVGDVQFCDHVINTELLDTLCATKAKIGTLYMLDNRCDLTGTELVTLCQKFKVSFGGFDEPTFKSEIWNDEILIPVIQASANISNNSEEEIRESTNLVTDRTLKALFGGDSVPPREISLVNVHNSFTVKEIVRSLQNICDTKCEEVNCNLGILQSNQLEDAERYFNGLNGALIYEFDIETERHELYNKYTNNFGTSVYDKKYEEIDSTSYIEFSVML